MKLRLGRLASKILQICAVLIILSMIVFTLAQLCPGDPLRSWYGDGVDRMSQAEKDLARENLGLNDSLVRQYWRWAANVLQGNLGISFQYKQPVSAIIGKMWGNSLVLCGLSLVLTFVLAILLGGFCVLNEGKRIDKIICQVGMVSSNIPSFFMALLFIYIFAVLMGIFPVGGAYSYGAEGSFLDRAWHLVLPVSVLVLEHLWYYAYMIRNMLLEETRKDYVMMNKAKGMSRGQILWKSCMKNVMPGIVVSAASSVPHLIGGTYIIESVFAYPGLGSLSFQAAMYKDYNMLMALCLVTAFVTVVFNMLAQVLSQMLDPRIGEDLVIGKKVHIKKERAGLAGAGAGAGTGAGAVWHDNEDDRDECSTLAGQTAQTSGAPDSGVRAAGARACSTRACGAAGSSRLTCVVLIIIFAACLLAPVIAPYSVTDMDLGGAYKHILGTDYMGRDLLSLILYGGRTSLYIGILAGLLTTAIAVIYGTISGLAGERADQLMMRSCELLMSIPSILMVLFLQAIWGNATSTSIAVVISLTGWMNMAKIVRTEVRHLRRQEYVIHAQLQKAPLAYVLVRHLMPSLISPIMYMAVSAVGQAMLTESTLSFLGLGLPLTTASWGSLLSMSQNLILTGQWNLIFIPGLVLVVTLGAITSWGEHFRKRNLRMHSNL